MSNEELMELADKGYITNVGEYEAALSGTDTQRIVSVEDAANKKDFVDATSYTEIKEQMDVDYKLTLVAADHCIYKKKVGNRWDVVSGELTCDKNQTVTIKVFADDDNAYEFEKWTDNLTDNPRMIVMDSSKSLTAIMKAKAPVEV